MFKDKNKLSFKKPILSTAGYTISTEELLRRLSTLHEELSSLVQDRIDLSSVDEYKNNLINKALLKHKNIGVRAYAACCISDILRLYAPDAPYTEKQLTEIFKLLLSQLERLGDSENGYYVQQTYLLTSLLEYRSIVLIADLPTSETLIEQLFSIFYDDSKTYNPKLYNVIGGLLGEVISELDTMPFSILRLIFNKFLTFDPNNVPKGLEVASNCGYEVSLLLCDVYSTRMSRHLTKYYSEILLDITDGDDDNIQEGQNANAKSLQKLHKLVLQLWKCLPDIIAAVIGFIFHELNSEKHLVRVESTRLIGNILCLESNTNFVSVHADTFNAWMSKIADENAEVRLAWIEYVPNILQCRNDITEEISKGLTKTFIDMDPRVRRGAVSVFDCLPVSVIWNNVHDISVYKSILHLTREKNREVRDLSIITLTKFFCKSMSAIDVTEQNKEIWAIVNSIPSTIFKLYYINDAHINEQVDHVVFTYLLPFEADNEKRFKKLLRILRDFDSKAFASFNAFNKRQLQLSFALSKFLDFCAYLNNNEEGSTQEDILRKYLQTIEWLSSGLSDPDKGRLALEALKELNDSRIYYLMKKCLASDVPFKVLTNCLEELRKKLQDSSLFRKHHITSNLLISPKEVAKQLHILLYRSSPIIYNVSNIPLLLENSKRCTAEELEIKRKLIKEISILSPTLFKDQINHLIQEIKAFGHADHTKITSIKENLKVLYKIGKQLKNDIDFEDTSLLTELKKLMKSGDPYISKYATKITALSSSTGTHIEQVRDEFLPLDSLYNDQLASKIVFLSEVFRFKPYILKDDSTDIVNHLIKNILLVNLEEANSNEDRWITNSQLYEPHFSSICSKIWAIKLLTNKLRSIAGNIEENEIARAFTTKTLKLFFYLIANGGELVSDDESNAIPTPKSYQSKLRCHGGLQVLKIARLSVFSSFIGPADVIKLINLVEDESFDVRKVFLSKLQESISNELISIKFLPLIFFTAYEPDDGLRLELKLWINYNSNRPEFKRTTAFERMLPRFIHAIAHHPDIKEDLQGSDENYLNAINTGLEYLVFYFDSIATPDNFSLLYYLAERVKNYQDRLRHGNDESCNTMLNSNNNNDVDGSSHMYIIGELSQLVLLKLKEKRGWQHHPYSSKLNLPGDVFEPFENVADARASFKTFLNEKYLAHIDTSIQAKLNRVIHSSQIQRQRAQTKLLAHEYLPKGRSKHKKQKLSRNRSDNSSDDDIDSSSENLGEERKHDHHLPVRKSHRSKRQVSYKDLEESDLE